jgi:hypothetical protein
MQSILNWAIQPRLGPDLPVLIAHATDNNDVPRGRMDQARIPQEEPVLDVLELARVAGLNPTPDLIRQIIAEYKPSEPLEPVHILLCVLGRF